MAFANLDQVSDFVDRANKELEIQKRVSMFPPTECVGGDAIPHHYCGRKCAHTSGLSVSVHSPHCGMQKKGVLRGR